METHFTTTTRSPPLRCFHKSVTDKLERLCSSPSSQTSRTSSLSDQPYEDEPHMNKELPTSDCIRADLKRLGRIEAVRIEHSIRKHDHRYYLVYVYLKSSRSPIYRRDPDYEIDIPFASFFSLRDTVLHNSRDHTAHCVSCLTRVDILRDHHDNAHDLSRLVRSTQEKEQRLEKFVHCLLSVCGDVEDLIDTEGLCEGCAATSHALAAFLKRRYQPSTGII